MELISSGKLKQNKSLCLRQLDTKIGELEFIYGSTR